MARRQCDQLITLTDEKRIGANDQGTGQLLDQRREGRIEIGFRAGFQDNQVQSKSRNID